MEEDCRPLGSEGHDIVDVDDDATSVTDSELSVASSSHRHQLDHQREILTSPPQTTTTTHEIDKKRTKKTAQKKCPATKKTRSKPTAKKKKKTTTTTKTTGQTVTSHVDHAAETAGDSGSESSCGLEASVEQVADRFAQGCECRDGSDSCFSNINPESAYRHRLNIAELTRSEHDMYLMGVTMASLSNPEETARRTERKRLHTQYVFQVRFFTQHPTTSHIHRYVYSQKRQLQPRNGPPSPRLTINLLMFRLIEFVTAPFRSISFSFCVV
jgi:hypothetical protein